MRYKFLCILLIFSIILSCTKSQIKESLKAPPLTNHYITATILPINLEGKEIAECIQKELKEDLQYLKFFPGDRFRENLFPWFEPNTAPQNIEELSALLTKPLVRKRIEGTGVELLICLHGYTKEYDIVSGGCWIALGGGAKRETHIKTTLWDLKNIISLGDVDISFKGTTAGGITIIPPFIYVIPAFTETKACKETAKRISDYLTGKDSSTDK
jgi:hypothetical protein